MKSAKFMTSWCGGSVGNSACNYQCKLCLIGSNRADLVDVNGSKMTFRIKNFVTACCESENYLERTGKNGGFIVCENCNQTCELATPQSKEGK